MGKTIKRVLAALLIIIGGVVLMQMTQDKFMRMFIIACIVFFATYLNKRTLKRRELAELHAQLEKELDEEERIEQQSVEGEIIEDAGDEPQVEDDTTNSDNEEPK